QQGALDVQQFEHASYRWKWSWTSGNGRFPSLFAFSAYLLEMIFGSLVEIKKCAISKCPACPPLRGTAFAGRRRPVQAVGAPSPLQLDPKQSRTHMPSHMQRSGVVLWHSE